MIRTVITLIAGFLILILPSCSVKEERTGCPCWLSVCLRNADDAHPEILHRNLTVIEWGDGLISKETVDVDDYMESPFYEKTVKRGQVTVSVSSPKARMSEDGTRLVIERGEQCDSIFAYASIVDCDKEFARDTAILHKQFATICLRMYNTDSLNYPYAIRIRGFYKGMDMTTLEPVAGGYVYEPKAQGSHKDIFTFRLPRQGDDSLLLDIYSKESIIKTIEIGKAITEQGYSWYTKDLYDIMLDIDFSALNVSGVHIVPWEKGLHLDSFII